MISADEELPAEKVLTVMLHKVFYCQQFSICDAVIPLRLVEGMASESYNSLTVVLNLLEHGTHCFVRRVSV